MVAQPDVQELVGHHELALFEVEADERIEVDLPRLGIHGGHVDVPALAHLRVLDEIEVGRESAEQGIACQEPGTHPRAGSVSAFFREWGETTTAPPATSTAWVTAARSPSPNSRVQSFVSFLAGTSSRSAVSPACRAATAAASPALPARRKGRRGRSR